MEFNVPAVSADAASTAAAAAGAAGGAAATATATSAATAAKPAVAYALLDGLADASKLMVPCGHTRILLDGGKDRLLDAKAPDVEPSGHLWIEMDLGCAREVLGVETQGMRWAGVYGAHETWVKRYRVDVSDDRVSWEPVGTFEGNYDSHTRVRNRFTSKPIARFVRLISNEYETICGFRWDVLVSK